MTVDGSFVDAKGKMDWAHTRSDREWDEWVEGNARGSGGVMLFGRKTYELMASFLEASSQSLCETVKSSVITTMTTGGEFSVEGVLPGRWSVFHVSYSQVEDQGEVQPSSIELLANETKSLP